jgi:hypothetical protein
MAQRYFNREDAEALLPAIRPDLERVRDDRQAMDSLDRDLAVAAARIMALGGSQPPYQELARKRAERDRMAAGIAEVVEKIQETGCIVKDLEEGLVDFPSRLNGQEIYLCWKLDEERIGWWHGIDEGFAGRKPLDDAPEEPPEPPGPSRVH